MSCVTLTASRPLACISPLAGITAIGVAAFDPMKKVVKDATGVTALASIYGEGTIARLEVKNSTVNYVENGISGGDNRSLAVTGTLPCVLNVAKGGDIETVKLVDELLKGEVVLFLETKAGDIRVAGSQFGALAITADDQTGGAAGDLNGFTITFNTLEGDYSRSYTLVSAGITDYAAALLA